MEIIHKPVLVSEVLEYLRPQPNQNFVDATVGGGGHAEKILGKTEPNGRLLGLDWDKDAITRAKTRLARFSKRVILMPASYLKLKEIVSEKKFQPIQGVLLDLGLSSDQLQASGRGFSFQVNEPLDMRFSPDTNPLTAAEIVNQWPVAKIETCLRELGEERYARPISRAIERARQVGEIKTTLELVQIIQGALPARYTRGKINPATRTFQALRIAVNDELNNVRQALNDICDLVEGGARIAVISFHSLEDKIVKDFFRQESRDCLCPPEIPVCQCQHKACLRVITKKPLAPSDKEQADNFRSRSAKLRVAEKI